MYRIGEELLLYIVNHPHCPDFDLLCRVGKVWYDSLGIVHVDGIYNQDLAKFIGKTMSGTQFIEYVYIPSDSDVLLDWATVTDALPHGIQDETYFFEYKGEVYPVNITVYCWERDHNKAYRQSDGNIEFDSNSSELFELVLRLIADGEVKVDPKDHNSDPVLESSTYIKNLRSDSVPTPPVIDTDVITNIDRGNSDNPRMSDWVPNPDSESEMGPASEKQVDGGFFSVTHNATNEDYKQRIRESAAGTTLPRTKWTKTKVLDTAIHSGVPEDKLEILSCMNLKDIHASLLVYDRTDITGNKYDSKQQRHTKFYRLRIDDILKLERNRHRNDTPLR